MSGEPTTPDVLTSEAFRHVIGHFASGVTVITSQVGDIPYGTTASAVSSLSVEPPMVLICMNRSSQTGTAVARSGRFAINILREDQHDLARRFASKDPDKFAGLPLRRATDGQPLLKEALAHLVCRVTEEVEGGTHVVFIATVDEAIAHGGAPLAYFRGEFGRLELALGHRPADGEAGRREAEEALDSAMAIEVGSLELARSKPVPDAARPADRGSSVAAVLALHDAIVAAAETPSLLAAYRRLGLPQLLEATTPHDPASVEALTPPERIREAITAGAEETVHEMLAADNRALKSIVRHAIARDRSAG
jgi:4-nitrophenol 2-monooxygenase / 4-nitrocatechol 4-monooxygenase, reductase component